MSGAWGLQGFHPAQDFRLLGSWAAPGSQHFLPATLPGPEAQPRPRAAHHLCYLSLLGFSHPLLWSAPRLSRPRARPAVPPRKKPRLAPYDHLYIHDLSPANHQGPSLPRACQAQPPWPRSPFPNPYLKQDADAHTLHRGPAAFPACSFPQCRPCCPALLSEATQRSHASCARNTLGSKAATSLPFDTRE